MIENSSPSNYSFVTSIDCALVSNPGNKDRLLVDCGATRHIINDKSAFSSFEENFDSANHFVELADGNRKSNIFLGKGTAKINLVDFDDNIHTVTLKEALFAPSFPTNLFSVKMATRCGAQFSFGEENQLIAPDGRCFPIIEDRDLYFLKSTSDVSAYKTMSLYDWHTTFGHLNYDDLLKMPSVADGIKISNTDRHDCFTCAMNKQTRESISKGSSNIATRQKNWKLCTLMSAVLLTRYQSTATDT